MNRKYTHRGWFGFCPIYIGGIHTDCPDVKARRPWLEKLLFLNIWLQETSIAFCSMVDPGWEPTWKIRITSEV